MVRFWPFDVPKILLSIIAILLLFSAFPARTTQAQETPIDPSELEAFLDDFITTQLETYQIPGAAVVIVADGKVLLTKGYGTIHGLSQRPVIADQTLFHVGSVTKLLTWTAVMQLVEQGRLDLHADVNTYLTDFQIPATYPEPITLFHLLTHTPGFEDQLSNLFRFSKDDGLPLADYVVRKLPARVYPPGAYIGYSNYGAALAGYIIQQVTGMPYEQYIEEHILAPLGMQRSSIRQPVPLEWTEDLALGHYPWPRDPVPLHEYFPTAPTVGLSSTVTDIAKFMIAHLQDGRYGEVRILQATTAQEMHRQQFTHDPRLPGVTYGFVEWERNGQHVLWHGGSTGFFESMLMLLPEQNVGAFVVYNRKVPVEPGREFRQAFLDFYYPTTIPAPQPVTGRPKDIESITGVYRESRWAHTTADKFIYMFTRYHRVKSAGEGLLTLDGVSYVEVAPLVFREVAGQGTLVFHTDASGRIVHGFDDFDPHQVIIKLAWYETRELHLGILAVCGLVLLSALLPWDVGAAPEHAPALHAPWVIAEARSVLRWLGIVNMLYPAGMLVIGITVLIDALPSLAFLAPLLILALVLPLMLAGVAVFVAWLGRYWSLGQRLYYTAVVFSGLVLAWWLNYWNLLRLWRF